MRSRALWRVPPKLEVYATTLAKKSDALATLAIATINKVDHPFYIRYTDKALYKLGKKMPRGVGRAHPAYIHVEKHNDFWYIYGVYLEDGSTCLLWKYPEPPAFLPQNLQY